MRPGTTPEPGREGGSAGWDKLQQLRSTSAKVPGTPSRPPGQPKKHLPRTAAMPINPFHEGATARVAPASIDDLEAGVTLNTTYDDAWGADAPKPREPQSDDEVVRVPHLELRALPEPAPSTSRSYDTASTQRLPSARRKREQREKARGKHRAAPACRSVAGVSLARRMTGGTAAPSQPPAPPPAPHQSPKSGLAARLARQSDDILLTETALDAVASQQPLSPSALRCQVAGDKHARMERKKAARRRKREEAMQGTFSAGPAASVLRV